VRSAIDVGEPNGESWEREGKKAWDTGDVKLHENRPASSRTVLALKGGER
jgi:hypothetical protein